MVNLFFFVFSALGAKKAKELSWIADVHEYNSNLISSVIDSLKSIRPKWRG